MPDGKVWLNSAAVTQYMFKMNYYRMTGDNRHELQGARVDKNI